MPLKIGLIGGGGEAWPHLCAHVHSQRVRTVSLAESDEETVARLRDRFGIIKHVTADYRELLADPEIAVVDLCLPPTAQQAVALEALTAGKHVLCSGPPAVTVEAAEALVEAARAADRRLLCVLFQRFIPAHVRTQALLAEATIGDPVLGSVSVQRPLAEAGALATERFHALDTLQSYLGPVRRVSGLCGGAGEGQPPTVELLSLEFDGGALGQISLLAAGAERASAERRLTGPEGSILIRDNPDDELPLVVLQGDGFFPIRLKAPPEVREFSIMAAMEHFLSCIEGGTQESVAVTEALAALRVSLAAERAVREGCTVTVA
ncbi:MAG: Gfo/Idh/MocA family oxidoreductase [Armatimonadota bacterium]